MVKVALIVVSLVEEAEEQQNRKLEAEITSNIDLSKIPWGKQLIKVIVFNCYSS